MRFETIRSFDDLSVVSNDLSSKDGLTLFSVMRNEMFFLPAFLSHYRGLGIQRFIILDDRSDDGTRAYLAKQADCMVVQSQRRFSQWVEIDHPMKTEDGTARIRNVWINLLLHKYALDRWAVYVDADEFLKLPDGDGVGDLATRLEDEGARALCSVMLDLYPANSKALRSMASDETLDTGRDWYYDARQHFALPGLLARPNWSQPRIVYPGSRARLMHTFGIRAPTGWNQIKTRFAVPGYNLIRKVALVKLGKGDFFLHSHRVSMPTSRETVTPIEHFKFSGQLYRRAEAAIRNKTHFNGSSEYHDMVRLLEVMEIKQATFLSSSSSADRRFDSYRRCKVALGFT
ncbi:MAG: glycosyltransferase family 2 protein [Pseudomonadota bacterium]